MDRNNRDSSEPGKRQVLPRWPKPPSGPAWRPTPSPATSLLYLHTHHQTGVSARLGRGLGENSMEAGHPILGSDTN